jgi:hypothetical protein
MELKDYFDPQALTGIELAKCVLPENRRVLTALDLLAGLCFGTALRGTWPEIERCLSMPPPDAVPRRGRAPFDGNVQRVLRQIWIRHGRRPLTAEEVALGLLPTAWPQLGLPYHVLDEILSGRRQLPGAPPVEHALDETRRQLEEFRRVKDGVPGLLAALASRVQAVLHMLECEALVLTEAYAAHRAARHFGTSRAEDARPPLGRLEVVLSQADDVVRVTDALRADNTLAAWPSSLDIRPLTPLPGDRPLRHTRVLRVPLSDVTAGTDDATSFSLEIQLFTPGEHTWYRAFERLIPPCDQPFTPIARQQLAELLRVLLDADDRIGEAIHTMRITPARSDRMSAADWDRLSQRAEAALEVDPDSTSALRGLLQAAAERGAAHRTRVEAAIRTHRARIAEHADLLRDAGFYLSKFCGPERVAEGGEMLRAAVDLDPGDPEAHCILGGHLRRQHSDSGALRSYLAALEVDPGCSYALSNILVLEVGRAGNPSAADRYRSRVPEPEKRCRAQFESGVNAPWAMFDLGLYALMRGDVTGALARYARGIADAAAWQVQSADRALQDLRPLEKRMPGLGELWKLLNVAAIARDSGRQIPCTLQDFPSPVLALSHQPGDGSDAEKRKALGAALAGFRGTLVSVGAPQKDVETGGSFRRAASRGPNHSYEPDGKAPRSILEALQFWEEYLLDGGDPSDVQWIVWNGPVGPTEGRIALAFGAEVGVARVGDDACARLCMDRDWLSFQEDTTRRLHPLAHMETDLPEFLDRIRV